MKIPTLRRLTALPLSLLALLAACSSSSYTAGGSPAPAPDMSLTPPSPDPRIGLAPGRVDSTRRRNILARAGEAIWNLRFLSNSPPAEPFRGVTNSDLAFRANYAIQGNYNGYMVWDISNPSRPRLVSSYLCPASQSDVSVYKNILFVSAEAQHGRIDCGTQGVQDTVSEHRIRGLRIFDATDIVNPKYVANVQTCRGSHTHTVVTDPKDTSNVYVYISGSSSVRSPSELPGCLDAGYDDPNTARFRIEVIRIPITSPKDARIVSSPRIFQDLAPAPRNAARQSADSVDRAARGGGAAGRAGGGGGGRAAGPPTGPNQCHDITTYPAIGLAGGACGGYGLLLDIRDVANPKRIDAAADSNFAFWHSATFNNDGTKILFTDEWGGGGSPKCRATDKYEWGADALFTLADNRMTFRSYYKMPAAQTSLENCVAHNGSLIPIPGRDIMVQGWYQGGISVFDWTDIDHPKEIAFHDRGPLDSLRMVSAGSWSVYWYNGVIVSSEIARGLDIFELVPSAHLTQNEIDAAKTVRLAELNAQQQPKFTWPPSFALSRAYLDQLERSNGLAAEKIATARAELTRAEKLRGTARQEVLSALATRLHGDARGAAGEPKAHLLASSVGDLSSVPR
jgi:hypothetical protein